VEETAAAAAGSTPSSAKSRQPKEMLKQHLCQVHARLQLAIYYIYYTTHATSLPILTLPPSLQELSKAGLNGMEQTVEKYINSIAPDAVSTIASPTTMSNSTMLAQMVTAIKQKLLSVATELVSSALKGGDRSVIARCVVISDVMCQWRCF
jgi:hypothetical protein